MSLAPLPKPACCIASSSHFHVVGISVSETVLDTNLRLDGTPEPRSTQIAVCPKTRERVNNNNNNNNNNNDDTWSYENRASKHFVISLNPV